MFLTMKAVHSRFVPPFQVIIFIYPHRHIEKETPSVGGANFEEEKKKKKNPGEGLAPVLQLVAFCVDF